MAAHRGAVPPRPGARHRPQVRLEQDLGQEDEPPRLPEADRLEAEDVAQGHAPQPRDQETEADEQADPRDRAERSDPEQVPENEAAPVCASFVVSGHGEHSFQMRSTRYSASVAVTRSTT